MHDRAPPHLLLLDDLRSKIRARHLSHRTEEAYASWAARYIRFHRGRHPARMGAVEIEAFLTHLSVRRRVAASTQNQAASALLFLYRDVLGVDVERPGRVVRARTPTRLPVVLTPAIVLGALAGLHARHPLARLAEVAGEGVLQGRSPQRDLAAERHVHRRLDRVGALHPLGPDLLDGSFQGPGRLQS